MHRRRVLVGRSPNVREAAPKRTAACRLESPPKRASVALAATLALSSRSSGVTRSTSTANDLPRALILEVMRCLAGQADLTGEWVDGDASALEVDVTRVWRPAAVPSTCKLWKTLSNDKSIWASVEPLTQGKAMNWSAFKNLGKIATGTEGTCFKMISRASGRIFAVKKSRVYPDGEGIPYYMLRELSFLMASRHPHIANIEKMNLCKFKLYCFFPFYETTLHELVARGAEARGSGSRGVASALDPATIQRFMFQLTDAVSFCHRRGVLHRNIKPKHVLIAYDEHGRAAPSLKLSDFALMRTTSVPRRAYTEEVVTLWYRSPEVLLKDAYHAGIDMWALGCVFCEMLIGKPMFPGMSQIDQLFQIFRALGVPDRDSWYNFESLPANGNSALGAAALSSFPNFPRTDVWLEPMVQRGLSAEGCALLKALLTPDPTRRICAEKALVDPFFCGVRPSRSDDVAATWLASAPLTPRGSAAASTEAPSHSGSSARSESGARSERAASEHHHATPMRFGCGGASDALAQAAAALAVDPGGNEGKTGHMQRDVLLRGWHALRLHAQLRATEEAVGPISDYLARMAATAAADPTRDAPPTAMHRSILVDWLIEVVDAYKMSQRTIYLAVSTFDRYLSVAGVYVSRRSLQLLGATCLHVASKVEDVSYIGVKDLSDAALSACVLRSAFCALRVACWVRARDERLRQLTHLRVPVSLFLPSLSSPSGIQVQ